MNVGCKPGFKIGVEVNNKVPAEDPINRIVEYYGNSDLSELFGLRTVNKAYNKAVLRLFKKVELKLPRIALNKRSVVVERYIRYKLILLNNCDNDARNLILEQLKQTSIDFLWSLNSYYRCVLCFEMLFGNLSSLGDKKAMEYLDQLTCKDYKKIACHIIKNKKSDWVENARNFIKKINELGSNEDHLKMVAEFVVQNVENLDQMMLIIQDDDLLLEALCDAGKHEQVISYYKKQQGENLGLYPSSVITLIAITLCNAGKYNQAKEWSSKLFDKESNYFQLNMLLIKTALVRGEDEAAKEFIDLPLATEDQQHAAMYYAMYFAKKGNYHMATFGISESGSSMSKANRRCATIAAEREDVVMAMEYAKASDDLDAIFDIVQIFAKLGNTKAVYYIFEQLSKKYSLDVSWEDLDILNEVSEVEELSLNENESDLELDVINEKTQISFSISNRIRGAMGECALEFAHLGMMDVAYKYAMASDSMVVVLDCAYIAAKNGYDDTIKQLLLAIDKSDMVEYSGISKEYAIKFAEIRRIDISIPFILSQSENPKEQQEILTEVLNRAIIYGFQESFLLELINKIAGEDNEKKETFTQLLKSIQEKFKILKKNLSN